MGEGGRGGGEGVTVVDFSCMSIPGGFPHSRSLKQQKMNFRSQTAENEFSFPNSRNFSANQISRKYFERLAQLRELFVAAKLIF